MAKRHLTDAQVAAVQCVIRKAIKRENSRDLMTVSDSALAVLCQREGIDITSHALAHHRKAAGVPGVPTRLRDLINGEGKK